METMIVSLIISGAVFFGILTLRKGLSGGGCGCSGDSCGRSAKNSRHEGTHEH